ncbi:MAG: hypothetical protein SCALA701_35730 [Candidatus Scalindua sp.]|nr:hypothetical protein [Planctomycetota bacterium]RZV74400.1 MAG: hypothetical protein EX341_12915 [Candidatus Scalindua sp. SCAELEC01]GJQ60772.1 MAG: hypothetical protein SCALA701_35730 [Candidatus Scalindua sp.]
MNTQEKIEYTKKMANKFSSYHSEELFEEHHISTIQGITDKIQLCEAAGSMGIQSADLFQFELLETLILHITTCFFSFQLNKIKKAPITPA